MSRLQADRPDRHEALAHRLTALEAELANLADTAARDGAVPAILAALTARDAERQRVAADLAAATISAGVDPHARQLRARLQAFLTTWEATMTANVIEARGLLTVALTDRIRFTPDADARRYELTVPIAFDRVLSAAIPEWTGLQDRGASPTGFEPVFWP